MKGRSLAVHSWRTQATALRLQAAAKAAAVTLPGSRARAPSAVRPSASSLGLTTGIGKSIRWASKILREYSTGVRRVRTRFPHQWHSSQTLHAPQKAQVFSLKLSVSSRVAAPNTEISNLASITLISRLTSLSPLYAGAAAGGGNEPWGDHAAAAAQRVAQHAAPWAAAGPRVLGALSRCGHHSRLLLGR